MCANLLLVGTSKVDTLIAVATFFVDALERCDDHLAEHRNLCEQHAGLTAVCAAHHALCGHSAHFIVLIEVDVWA